MAPRKSSIATGGKRKASAPAFPVAPASVPELKPWENVSALPVRSVLGQFPIDKPVPFDVLMAAYKNEDQKLKVRLSASYSVDQILSCFQLVPCGSLNHCGTPTLSDAELHRLSLIVADFLREVLTVDELRKVYALPETIKRSAWALLSAQEKKIIRAIAVTTATAPAKEERSCC